MVFVRNLGINQSKGKFFRLAKKEKANFSGDTTSDSQAVRCV